MLRHQTGFSDEMFERVKAVLRVLGQQGPFSGDDALKAMLVAGITNHAGDIAAVLDDLEDDGFLRQTPGSSPHWELAVSPAS